MKNAFLMSACLFVSGFALAQDKEPIDPTTENAYDLARNYTSNAILKFTANAVRFSPGETSKKINDSNRCALNIKSAQNSYNKNDAFDLTVTQITVKGSNGAGEVEGNSNREVAITVKRTDKSNTIVVDTVVCKSVEVTQLTDKFGDPVEGKFFVSIQNLMNALGSEALLEVDGFHTFTEAVPVVAPEAGKKQ